MSLPTTNQHFEQGDFRGFTTYGICQVAKDFRAWRDVHTFAPVSGRFFAVLDDPRDVTGDGARTATAAAYPPADTAHYTLSPDADHRTTFGADGAILECCDCTIAPGQSLWFHWAFARFDWSPANDFALFEAYECGDLTKPPTTRILLAQSIELEQMNRWYTDWHACAWRPQTPFNGTVRWVVSNGMSTSNPWPSPGANARPSALLLDCIKID